MQRKRIIWPIAAFLVGSGLMASIYFGIVSLAEGFEHALDFFITDRWLITPLILGFGIQSALYIVLKKQLFIPITNMGASGTMTGAGGTTSTIGMVACCAHHVTDVLPILGLSAAATFLAEYQTVFMFIGLGTTLIGILVMVGILLRERRKALGVVVDSKSILASFNKKPVLVLASLVGIIGIGFGVAKINPPEPTTIPRLQEQVTQESQAQESQAGEVPVDAAQPEKDQQTVEESETDENYPLVLESVPSDVKLWFSGETKLDEQGAVVVEVTPLHLNMQTNTLYFGVALNTHSIDLSMDIAKLATMVLDSGELISAEFWDAPAGGHHVSGTLSFSLTDSQIDQLGETNSLQISITKVDAAERLLTWTRGE